MTFKTAALADLTNIILNSDEFAEVVTFKPLTGSSRQIKAVVFRAELQPFDLSAGRSLTKTCRVIIAKDATLGAATIDKGGDKISFAEIEGGTVIDWRVVDIINDDLGAWNLTVRK